MARNLTKTDAGQYEDRLERIKLVTGVRTQVQLAEVLGVRQSSISDSKRRGSVPAEWLLKLQRGFAVNPDWIMNGGNTPKYVVFADEHGGRLDLDRLRGEIETQVRAEMHPTGTAELIATLRSRIPGLELVIADSRAVRGGNPAAEISM